MVKIDHIIQGMFMKYEICRIELRSSCLTQKNIMSQTENNHKIKWIFNGNKIQHEQSLLRFLRMEFSV